MRCSGEHQVLISCYTNATSGREKKMSFDEIMMRGKRTNSMTRGRLYLRRVEVSIQLEFPRSYPSLLQLYPAWQGAASSNWSRQNSLRYSYTWGWTAMDKMSSLRWTEPNSRLTDLNARVAYTEHRASTRIGNAGHGHVSVVPLVIFLAIQK